MKKPNDLTSILKTESQTLFDKLEDGGELWRECGCHAWREGESVYFDFCMSCFFKNMSATRQEVEK